MKPVEANELSARIQVTMEAQLDVLPLAVASCRDWVFGPPLKVCTLKIESCK